MNVTVTLYKNTGYDSKNVPDAGTRLSSGKTVPAVWLYQNYPLSTIRIKYTWDDIQGVDYVKLNDAYYFVDGIKMINENTCELAISYDALTTVGISNITFNGGWCTRRHVESDEMLEWSIPEDFSPNDDGVVEYESIDFAGDSKTFVASTVGLSWDNLYTIAKTYEDATTKQIVTVPQVPPPSYKTEFRINTPSVRYDKEVPGVTLYDFDAVYEQLALVRSLGLDDCLVGCYNIPRDLIVTATQGTGEIRFIEGKIQGKTSALKFAWSSKVKNNKVFSGQFNKYLVCSMASGDKTEYEASNIGLNNAEAPTFLVLVDPAPEGKTYLAPSVFQGTEHSSKDIFMSVTEGAQWQSTPILYRKTSGSSTEMANYNYQYDMARLDFITQQAQIAASMAGNLAGKYIDPAALAGDAIQGLTGMYRYNRTTNINNLNFLASQLKAPEMKFPRTANMQDYIGNGFLISRTRLSDADTERYDKYLTMYGYRVNEPLTKSAFTCRKYFNYVECSDLSITIPSKYPLIVRQMIIDTLTSGVRIWHKKPSSSYFTNNPIV